MIHAADGDRLDHILARRCAPYASRMSRDIMLDARASGHSMHVDPLLERVLHVFRIDDGVGGAVPDGDFGPWSAVGGSGAHQATPVLRGLVASARHALERCVHIRGTAVWQTRDNGSAGEHLRIGRQHRGAHRSTCRQPDDEHAPPVDAMVDDHALDHLADGERLAAVAPYVGGKKPVEAVVGIVGALLLRKQHRKAMGVGQCRPSRTMVVDGGGLGAAVQGHDQGGIAGELSRHVRQHAQIARIAAEAGDFVKLLLARRRAAACALCSEEPLEPGPQGRKAGEGVFQALHGAGPSLRTRGKRSARSSTAVSDIMLHCSIARSAPLKLQAYPR